MKLQIIEKAGKDIGCISIMEELDHISLSLIEILPKYQNQGIGSTLIKDTIAKAEINKSVKLQVLKTNKKAFKLYERLGFILEEETETHFKLIYKEIQ